MHWQLAQLNIAHMRFPLDHEQMAGFVAGLEPMNQLADQSEGFVWRLQDESGNATEQSPFEDPLILINMSVWDDISSLQSFAYKTAHRYFIKDRKQWFEAMDKAHQVLWWVPEGQRPSTGEALSRLGLLRRQGPGPWAFNFARQFAPPEAANLSAVADDRHAALLREAGLPDDDFLSLPNPSCLRAEQAGELCAAVALEPYDQCALLRSLVVQRACRGGGLGRDLVLLAQQRAAQLQLRELWLLTEGADQFFESLGFERVERDCAPAALAQSAQFSHLCPAQSHCMRFVL